MEGCKENSYVNMLGHVNFTMERFAKFLLEAQEVSEFRISLASRQGNEIYLS